MIILLIGGWNKLKTWAIYQKLCKPPEWTFYKK